MIAFVFPGQGSQKVGMGKELAEAYPQVAAVFAAADAALGEPLSELCFSGPEDVLRQTRHTQPAIVATSIAIYRLVREYVAPACVAGHSLGEYAALAAAGGIALADAVRVVRQRGLFMEAAVAPGRGAMAALLGLDAAKVAEICRQAGAQGVVEPATLNGGGQVVVAGEVAAVRAAMDLALQAGARRAQMLNVSGPFHTSLLQPAGARLQQVLAEVDIKPPQVPVYANATASGLITPAEIRSALVRQVSAAVRWEESIAAMWDAGVRSFVEIGPGKVLSGLIRRIAPEATVCNVEDKASLEAFIARVKGDVII